MCESEIYRSIDYVTTKKRCDNQARRAIVSTIFMPEYLEVTEFCVNTQLTANLRAFAFNIQKINESAKRSKLLFADSLILNIDITKDE